MRDRAITSKCKLFCQVNNDLLFLGTCEQNRKEDVCVSFEFVILKQKMNESVFAYHYVAKALQ